MAIPKATVDLLDGFIDSNNIVEQLNLFKQYPNDLKNLEIKMPDNNTINLSIYLALILHQPEIKNKSTNLLICLIDKYPELLYKKDSNNNTLLEIIFRLPDNDYKELQRFVMWEVKKLYLENIVKAPLSKEYLPDELKNKLASNKGTQLILESIYTNQKVEYANKLKQQQFAYKQVLQSITTELPLLKNHQNRQLLPDCFDEKFITFMSDFGFTLTPEYLNVNQFNAKNEPPIIVAARYGYNDIILKLLDLGANIAQLDRILEKNGGKNALINAAMSGHLETVRLLVANKSPLNIADNRTNTALCRAIECGHNDIAEFLIKNGATLKAASCKKIDGEYIQLTPLYIALRTMNSEITRLLFEYGADPKEKISPRKGFTTVQLLLGPSPQLKEENLQWIKQMLHEYAVFLYHKGARLYESPQDINHFVTVNMVGLSLRNDHWQQLKNIAQQVIKELNATEQNNCSINL